MLTGTVGADAQQGDQFTIITATGGITGKINGNNGTAANTPIANDTVVELNGRFFVLNYSADSVVLTLEEIPTTTNLQLSPSTGDVYGQTVTLTANVAAEIALATGTEGHGPIRGCHHESSARRLRPSSTARPSSRPTC